MEFNNQQILSVEDANKFVGRVYRWMTLALVITGLVALYVVNDYNIIAAIVSSKLVFFGLLIGELALVAFLSSRIHTLNYPTAIGLFIAYSVLNGVTMSIYFLVYTSGSIALAFFITAGTFVVMSIFGTVTKADLTSLGALSGMALLGIIIASVVNLFIHSSMLYYIISYVGVIVFVGLIAYDTQKLMVYASNASEANEMDKKMALLGALTLYLDFINLLIMILRILGKKK